MPGGPGMAGLARAKNPRGALSRLATYFGAFRTRLAFVAACIFVYTGLGLMGPYLMGVAIDRFIASSSALSAWPPANQSCPTDSVARP